MKIKVDERRKDYINSVLTYEPESEEDVMVTENDTIVETADFGNGIEMDIKVCGVEFEEGEDNRPYTEAVLFKDGCEVGCTEPEDEFFGVWEIEYDGVVYEVEVE